MIDLSSIKSPGWQRVVAELLAPAPDDREFLARLVAIMAQVSGARQGVLMAVDAPGEDPASPAPEPRPVFVWPPADPGVAEPPPVEHGPDVRSAARVAASSGQLRIFGLETGEVYYGEEGKGSVIAVPLQDPPASPGDASPRGPRAVVTLLVEPRSRPALQSTSAILEILAGYTHLHASRQQAQRARASVASLDLAARLIAAINGSGTFKGAALQLVNDLQRHLRADRVALGWVRGHGSGGAVRAVAVSDTEHLDRRVAVVQRLEAAMDECLDQERAVLFPPPGAPGGGGGADPVLAQAITHAHRELAASDARLRVVSLPLRHEDRVVGVVTIESLSEAPADSASIDLLQSAMDLVAPVMLVRRSDDRMLPVRAYAATLNAGEWLVGPRHTAWKLAGLVLLLASLFVTFFRVEYRVEAPMELQPRVRAIVAAPFDGVIASLGEGAAPGARVSRGDVLVRLDTREVQLRVLDFRARMTQASKEADAALKAGNRQSEFQQAQARAAQAEANLRRAEMELEQAVIRAPLDGTILAGDLSDRVGAAVRLGDPLMQVAPLDDMLIVARLSDRDIGLVRDGSDPAGPGRGLVATKADPASARPLTVERIVPLAQSKDGRNAFEVRARFDEPPSGLRPGMEGFARFDAGRRSLLWIGTRRLRDQARLWLWW